VRRDKGETGVCGQSDRIRVARAALHFWEETCISGEHGSGTVFFSGCPLRCVFCQNEPISTGGTGKEITGERLAEIFLELQEKGAHNINLVTAGHFIPQVTRAIDRARAQGLHLPIVYNTGGYERVEAIRSLEGYVDIYLPDFKFMDEELAGRYARAGDYPRIAKDAIAEMVRQTGAAVFRDGREDSLMERGTIVRHLVLPGHTKDSKAIIRYLHETYGNAIYVSILNQFTPTPALNGMPELNRRLTRREYDEVVDYALSIGVECGFIQEGETAGESFIPDFASAEGVMAVDR
jgi:putative pyruvate formate lyase activating enzyme